MRTIEWKGDAVYFIDQTKLPRRLIIAKCDDHEELARAIENMKIRGAPALGVAAAMGIALAAKNSKGKTADEIKSDLVAASKRIRSTRPTARNLFWGLERMERVWRREKDPSKLIDRVIKEAGIIADEDVQLCRGIGRHGAELIFDGDNILTHCNAGGLACVEYGTALGVIRSAVAGGKKVFVYATETRPLLQGARLTAFELKSEGIPFKLITDNMVGYVMQKGLVDKVVVGADRITKRGDVINKIGTYGIAVLARAHGIPFYVAAPSSTIDLLVRSEEIEIEERKAEEVTTVCGKSIAPRGTDVLNPAFDLTPKELVSAIITEKGVAYPPYDLSVLLGKS
ncbi:MAG: S-methyl-5-thioribose-1-phosphate isomerase [Candidatus Methanomethylicaceae archaeon]|jgi:methylthioribose-1-phosphate isomerase